MTRVHATAEILLATLNAKYLHASLGLRYLHANLGELADRARLCEYVIEQRPLDIAEDLLAHRPRIIGLGVYVWNVEETTQLVALLKCIAPEVVIVLGGPEVSYANELPPVAEAADYVIMGWGEIPFAELCRALLSGERPSSRLIAGEQPPLEAIVMPYDRYTDADLAQRLTYVEASRGCPYKCEFCLSALDRTAWPFELERLLGELARLHARGARHFKFVDRTFNLSASTSRRILEFILARLDDRLFLHFELVPDRLPAVLQSVLARFPPGTLQFEIGVQTFDEDTQLRIGRRQDNAAAERNLRWLRAHTAAHLHVDLIAGLPGEDLASFGRGFDRLIALDPHEIQVGILKRLRGAPIARHTQAFGMRYNPHPPYNVLATGCIDFVDMQRLSRFARYWDLVGNSGRFVQTRAHMLGATPFARFLRFSDWLYRRTRQTHRFAVDRLFDLVAEALVSEFGIAPEVVRDSLLCDYAAAGQRGRPEFLSALPGGPATTERPARRQHAARQARHQRDG